jgi:hypothetical protein
MVWHWMDAGDHGRLETSRKGIHTRTYRTLHHVIHIRFEWLCDSKNQQHLQLKKFPSLTNRAHLGGSSFIMVRRSNGIHHGFMELDWFHFKQLLPGLDIFTRCRLVHRSGKETKQVNFTVSVGKNQIITTRKEKRKINFLFRLTDVWAKPQK